MIALPCGLVNRRGRAVAVHDAERYAHLIEHGVEHAADGAFLGPDFDQTVLVLPPVSAILRDGAPDELVWVIPGSSVFRRPCLIDHPVPVEVTVLPCPDELGADAVGVLL